MTPSSTAFRLGTGLLLATLAAACGASTPQADPQSGAEQPAAADPADMPASEGAKGEAAPGDVPSSPSGSAAAASGAPVGKSPVGKNEAPAEEAPKPSAMDLAGKLSTAQVSKFVEDHQSYFDPCITIAEKAGRTYKVSITTKAYVGPQGRVNTTEVVKSTSKDKAFDACVTDAFKKIHFGKPKEGATATLTFPMTFVGEQQ